MASNIAAHAEGYQTTAMGEDSHAEGYLTVAGGENSHAEGYNTTASGKASHTEGLRTKATAVGSHAAGIGTNATVTGQAVVGLPNTTDSQAMFIVGGGTYNSTSYEPTAGKNLFTVKTNGNLQMSGSLITVPKGDFIVSSATSPSFYKSTKALSNSFKTGNTYTGMSGTITSYNGITITISVSVKQKAQTVIAPTKLNAGVTITGASGSVNKSFDVTGFPSGYNKTVSSSYGISLTASDLQTMFGTTITRDAKKTVSYSVY
jgi:hypothetical protein